MPARIFVCIILSRFWTKPSAVIAIAILIFAFSLAFTSKRLLRYLRFLQQEEYQTGRFFSWIRSHGAIDRKGSGMALFAILFAAWSSLGLGSMAAIAAALGILLIAVLEEDPREAGKIPLRMTERAKRIYVLAVAAAGALLFLLLCYALFRGSELSLSWYWFFHLLYYQSVPVWLALAVRLLQPGEDRRQAVFLQEATDKIAEMHPYVIGITGSFGKTSTKAILGKILEVTLAPTFCPPKSINTLMGITREIREQLKEGQKYAVIEMGAYARGSIARLCALTPPQAAIVTAVGYMHLERFGSHENILLAKSELAQAVPMSGVLICNADDEGAREIAKRHPKARTFLYSIESQTSETACRISNVETRIEGTSFTIHWNGKEYPAFTPLHGRPSLSNILAAFTMACALGAQPPLVVAAIGSLEPVDNRLQVKRFDGYTQINDAYNSNPLGFAAALDVLAALPGKRKILVTPGMIELGGEQAVENERVAKLAARVCDLVLVVGEINRAALASGLLQGGLKAVSIIYCSGRKEALEQLGRIRGEDDVVLLENDLPDLYEFDLSF